MKDGSAAHLLALAEDLLRRPSAPTAGLWPRAAALLARQALEKVLDEFWQAQRVALDACPARQQLICLGAYLHDAELAGQVHQAWAALSRACHHHPYELAPTQAELQVLLSTVKELAGRVAPTG